MSTPKAIHYAAETAERGGCGRKIQLGYLLTLDVRLVSCKECRAHPAFLDAWVAQTQEWYLRSSFQGEMLVWDCHLCGGCWKIAPVPSTATVGALKTLFHFEHRGCCLKADAVPLAMLPALEVFQRVRPKFVSPP